MSYSEDSSGNVVLRMSRADYDRLLIAMGSAVGAALQGQGMLGMRVIVPLLNRLNEGNPNYTPYAEVSRG